MKWYSTFTMLRMAPFVPVRIRLVVIDDSIVRGTTLKESIIRMLGRLKPKRIIVVSSIATDPLPRLLWYRHEQDG